MGLPGGREPYSLHLMDSLAAGSVPVVTDDLVLPWQDTGLVDWESCAMRISEAELYSLPKVLRKIGSPGSRAYVERRRACQILWSTISNGTNELWTFDRRIHELFWSALSLRVRNTRLKQTQ